MYPKVLLHGNANIYDRHLDEVGIGLERRGSKDSNTTWSWTLGPRK